MNVYDVSTIKTTKKALLQNPIAIAVYEKNGRRLTFKVVAMEMGVPYGYCAYKGVWARLYPKYFDDEKNGIVIAEQISYEKY